MTSKRGESTDLLPPSDGAKPGTSSTKRTSEDPPDSHAGSTLKRIYDVARPWLHFLGRRLLQLIPVFFGATFILFALVYLMPGDPVRALGGDKGLTPAAEARIRAEYHLDKPMWMQYLLYLKGVVTLDFGKTFSGNSVASLMQRAFPVTFRLAFMALVFEAIIGMGIGIYVGMRRGKFFDKLSLAASLVLISVPVFVIGFVAQYLIGLRYSLLPATVGSDISFQSLFMPAIVLGSTSIAYVLRLTRQSISEVAPSDFVRTARAKGLANGPIMRKHILRNSLIPVVTFLGTDLGALMGGAVITESIFNIKGIGGALWNSIRIGEPSAVVSISTVLVLVYIVANLVVDILYAVIDPRIRYE